MAMHSDEVGTIRVDWASVLYDPHCQMYLEPWRKEWSSETKQLGHAGMNVLNSTMIGVARASSNCSQILLIAIQLLIRTQLTLANNY
jgi:hypothetical protein